MASLKDRLKDLKQESETVKEIRDALRETFDADRRRTRSLKESRDLQFQILGINKDIEKINNVSRTKEKLGLEKQISNFKKGTLNSLNKELDIESQITLLTKKAEKGTEEQIKNSKKYAKLLGDVGTGAKDLEDVLNDMVNEDFGEMLPLVEQLAETLKNTPDLTEKLKIEANAQQKIDDFRDKIKETSALLSSPKAMGVAAIGMAVKLMSDFANKALDVRQSLGTTAVESARVAGNLTVAATSAKLVGGSSEQAEAAVMSLVDEFGSVSVISAGVSKQLGLVTGQFGLSGDNAGKLLKQMQAINGSSIETNLNLISSVGELARAEGVAPAKVLNDIAGDTETFAKFAKDGGKNIGAAAIQAAKLGLNMATVAGIAENLLDFESSIEKQMEASVLLGRQLNLDKARELSLMGDLEGLQKEVLKQVGSEADFNAMNVMQRKALADAIGVSVVDLGKMVAGEQTSAQAAAERVKQERKSLQLQKAASYAALVTAAAQIGGGFGKFGPIGFGLAIPAIMGLYSLAKGAPKAQTGGVVRETGMAVVHKGESIAGTQFGGRESNNLLKELIKQNSSLMGKLTNKVGEMALSS